MKAIFLDRDGVINKDAGFGDYIRSWKAFEFLPGSLEALKKLTQSGFDIFIISNQAGVAKGLYTKEDVQEINRVLLKQAKAAGARIHSIHYCFHQDSDNCDCRKPKTGLFIQAAEGLDVDFKNTYFIGDSRRDVLAARAIGTKSIFVLSGNTKLEDLEVKPDFIAGNLLSAVEKIVLKNANLKI